MREDFLADVKSILTAYAISLGVRSDHPMFEDAVQEGLIAAWAALDSGEHIRDPQAYAVSTAKLRVKNVALRPGVRLTTGDTKTRRYEPATVPTSAFQDSDGVEYLPRAFASQGGLEGVEMAAHREEIRRAVSSLTPAQRRYVFARFWCGIDATGGLHMNPGVKAARDANPFLRRDVLWTGAYGAKGKLRSALAHLAEAS